MCTGCPFDIQGVTSSVLLFLFQYMYPEFNKTTHKESSEDDKEAS